MHKKRLWTGQAITQGPNGLVAALPCCAAKFMAESVMSEVGRETFVPVRKPNQRGFVLFDSDVESLRQIWSDKGKRRILDNLDARLREHNMTEIEEERA